MVTTYDPVQRIRTIYSRTGAKLGIICLDRDAVWKFQADPYAVPPSAAEAAEIERITREMSL